MKKHMPVYYLSVIMSMLVGLWHFFVPLKFQWYEYLPMQYSNLIVGIDYTNYCFSALLFGLSLLLIVFGKKAFEPNREVLIFYTFLTVIWVFRAVLPPSLSRGHLIRSPGQQLCSLCCLSCWPS